MVYEMRSENSESVVKKKSSSGCLIIKKKVGDGFSGSSSRNSFNPMPKKRPPTDSESSDDDDVLQLPDNSFSRGGFMEHRQFEAKNGLDVFEFDEYDGIEFDGRRIRKNVNDYDDRHRLKLYGRSADHGGSSSGRLIVDKRRDFYYNDNDDDDDDDSHLPLSVLSEKYREVSDEQQPIRLQGKNGVLKVMVNKHKHKRIGQGQGQGHGYVHVEGENQKGSGSGVLIKRSLNAPHKDHDRFRDTNKKKTVIRSSFYTDLKRPVASKSKEKGELKFAKPKFGSISKETDDSDTLLHSKSSAKVVKNEGTENANVTHVKGKESKVKRGSGTEKQLLREKIRSMLLGAGWTIDYRPRRNRDYLDAVYINPSGTAYWSIIKAYEALQKEEEDHSKAGGDFTPLPDEILSKLTRQTRKKIEREMKKKRRDEGKGGNGRNAKRARVKASVEDAPDIDQQEEKLSSYMKQGRKETKSRLEEASQDSADDDDDDASNNSDKETHTMTSVDISSQTVHGRKSRKIGRCTLLVRSSDKGPNSNDGGFIPYSGKRTLLSWLIDSGTVHMSEKVQYMNRRKTRAMLEGWITNEGIHCGCCSKILAVSKFELHAGSKLRQSYSNIFTPSGQSLTQCQVDAWNKQGESERKGFHVVEINGDDPDDDTCGLCGDGGDLICCDGCPSTFHQSCLGIQMLPQGDWHCPNCSCKYCGTSGGNSTEASGRTESSLLMCSLCEKKYHESCNLEMDGKLLDTNDSMKPVDPSGLNLSFCSQKCRELYIHLHKLLGVKHELDSGFSWSLIHRSDLLSDASSVEFSQRVECNSKLAVAMSVIDECFLPIVDRRSGINLIRNVVYNCGSNFSRLNYGGFFTAILEKSDEMICAASIRIHGTQLAEMPFIGTRHMYRRQGMCRRLLSAIESALFSLGIMKLVIPAIAEHMNTWTDVFGFGPLEESHKREMRSINMLVFPGTDMLQKPLVMQVGPQGKTSVETDDNQASFEKSEVDSWDENESSDKIAITDSGSRDPNVPFDDACSVDVTTAKHVLLSTDKSELVSVEPNLDTAMENGSHAISSCIPCEPEIHLSGNKTIDETALVDQRRLDSKMEEVDQKIEETANLLQPQVPDVACSEPQLQVLVIDESVAHSDSIVAMQMANDAISKSSGVDLLQPPVPVPSNDIVSRYIPCGPELERAGEESVYVNGSGTNLPRHDQVPCEPNRQHVSGRESNAHFEVTDAQLPSNDTISCEPICVVKDDVRK